MKTMLVSDLSSLLLTRLGGNAYGPPVYMFVGDTLNGVIIRKLIEWNYFSAISHELRVNEVNFLKSSINPGQ